MDAPQNNGKKLHPVLWVAAVAVTIFSAVGVAAITGIIPIAGGSAKPIEPAVAVAPADAAPATQQASADAAIPPAPAPTGEVAQQEGLHMLTPARTPRAGNDLQIVAREDRTSLPAPSPPPDVVAQAVCRECGVIESVREVRRQGEGTGAGAIAGGVLGGVIGHQLGSGRGRDATTVLGAVGGAFAGNQVEKSARSTSTFKIVVRYDDGSSEVFTRRTAPRWRRGDRVRVIDGEILAD